MSLNNALTLARQHTIFAVAETTRGTLVFPAASNLVIPAGYGQIGQVPTYSDSEEIVDTRSLIEQFRDAVPSGDWSLPMYIRPSGTAGSVPQGAALLKSLFGSEAIVGATSVEYTLAKQLPSFSLWVKYGDAVFFATGATADSAKGSFTKKGAVKLDLSGKFMALGWCGTDELYSAITYVATPITAIPVKDAKKYTVGGKVTIGTSTNTGAGHAITAVNTSTNTLTVTPGVSSSQLINALVVPFLPTGTIIGEPVESRTTTVSFDGGSTTIKVKGFDFSMGNGIQYQEDEISDVEYATDYVEGDRVVTGSATMIMRRDDLKYFHDGLDTGSGTEKSIKISCGPSVAGDRVYISMTRCQVKVPTLNPTSPTVELKMDFTAMGTSGEDEITMMFN